MSLLTDNQNEVGMHAFERAGLGKAPFKFVSFGTKTYQACPGAPVQPGSSCDYCGTAISGEFWIKSADGKHSKVGCNCIEKVGDKGLIRAYKNSPEFRKLQREKRHAKDVQVTEELQALFKAKQGQWSAEPHPYSFVDRKTGLPLSKWDYVQFMFNACGASGRYSMLRRLKKEEPTP